MVLLHFASENINLYFICIYIYYIYTVNIFFADDIMPGLTTPEELDQLHFPDGHDAERNDTETQKIKPVVTIPEFGKDIYKATLVSLLNKDSKLSSDRYLIFLLFENSFLIHSFFS